MSLTTFLEHNADVRAQLRATFVKPDFRLKSSLLAPPLTESYGLVGTAFDYVLRFYVEKLNPGTQSSSWVSEQGLAILCAYGNRRKAGNAIRQMAEAKKRYAAFLRSTRTRRTSSAPISVRELIVNMASITTPNMLLILHIPTDSLHVKYAITATRIVSKAIIWKAPFRSGLNPDCLGRETSALWC
jgi:hypothetical protein